MTDARRLATIAIPAAAVGALAAAGLYLLTPPTITAPTALLALAIIAVGLVPTLAYMVRRDAWSLPFLPAIGLFYAITFGAPVFWLGFVWPDGIIHLYRQTPTIDTAATAVAALGIGLLVAAMILGRRLFNRLQFRLHLPPVPHSARLRVLAWLSIGGHLAYLYLTPLQKLPSVGQTMPAAGWLGFGIFLVLALQRTSPRWETAAVFLLGVPLKIAPSILEGTLAPTILFLLFLGVLILRFAPWLALVLIGSAIIAIPLLYLPMQMLRGETWMTVHETPGETNPRDPGPLKRSALLACFVVDRCDTSTVGPTDRLRSSLNRLSQIGILARVIEVTPQEVPYWNGETYRPLATSLIPRVLWPSKPEERAGNAFGQRYGFVSPEDRYTSINLSWPVELYANFGLTGIALGMIALGLFMAALDRAFNAPEMTPLETVLGWSIIFPLVLPESNLSLMIGSLPLVALALWAYLWIGLKIGTPQRTSGA